MGTSQQRSAGLTIESETWPPLPRDKSSADERELELLKIRYEAELDNHATTIRDRVAEVAKQSDREWEREKNNWEREKAEWAAEYTLHKSVHDARLELAKTAIERGRSGAEFVRNAASAIVTLYTGTLALAFAVEDKAQAAPLPVEGVLPAIFLALAIVFSTAYVAFLTKDRNMAAPTPHSSLRVLQERRLNGFIDWASSLALVRAHALHASVISLGFGAVFLPSAFLDWPHLLLWIGGGIALMATVLVPLLTARRESSPGSSPP